MALVFEIDIYRPRAKVPRPGQGPGYIFHLGSRKKEKTLIPIHFYRPHPKFVCQSTSRGGGGVPQSGLAGGVPYPRSDQTRGGGTPSQVWMGVHPHDQVWMGYPPGPGMGSPSDLGLGIPWPDLGWGTPHAPGMGDPPGPGTRYPPDLGPGTPPRPWTG